MTAATIDTVVDEIELELYIENYYDGDMVVTTPTARVPSPAGLSEDELEDWADDNLFEHTGTGQTEGNSAYTVKITAADPADAVPGLVGREFEFGF